MLIVGYIRSAANTLAIHLHPGTAADRARMACQTRDMNPVCGDILPRHDTPIMTLFNSATATATIRDSHLAVRVGVSILRMLHNLLKV